MGTIKRIKHNFITIMPLKAAALVGIGAFVFTSLAGQTRLPLAVGQAKGVAILTAVRVDNRPLSPSQILVPVPNSKMKWGLNWKMKTSLKI